MRPGGLIALILVLAAVVPAAAHGATLTRSGDTYTLTGAAGEPNELGMVSEYSPSRGAWILNISDRAPIQHNPAETQCEGSGGAPIDDFLFCGAGFGTDPNRKPVLIADAGDGDDRIILASAGDPNVARGGPGNDKLYSTGGADTLDGGDGDDEFFPEDVFGSVLPPDFRGADSVVGGPGTDTVSYRSEPPVTLTLDGRPGDTADGDNVLADVENVIGSDGADSITGSAANNRFEGLQGNDTLNGLGGDDQLNGDSNNDTIDGGDGNDTLEGGSDDDRLVGGGGTDSFSGDFSGGFNQIVVGNDRIEARDGIGESISCGPGSDVAVIDATDTPTTDPQNACETIDRAAGGAAPPGPGTTATAGLSVRSTTLRYRDGRIKLSLRCAGTATCRGVLSIRTRGTRPRTIVSGRYAISGGRTRTLTFKVGASGKRTIGRKRSLKINVRVVKAGQSRAATKALSLRR